MILSKNTSRDILNPDLLGHRWGGSNPSVEVQSMYSTATAVNSIFTECHILLALYHN